MIKNILVTSFVVCLSLLSYGEEALTMADVAAIPAANETAPVVAAATTEVTAAPAVAAVETTKLAENQIPLSIEASKKVAESGSTGTKALFSGVIVLILLATTYYFVRRYKTSNKINKSNMQIKVLTQHYLGPKKSLAIVHVAGESMLIGVTDNNISMIKSLSLIDDEVPAEMPKTFTESMAKKAGEAQPMVDELDEEFSFAGVTDTVSKKIKSMRSFS